MNLVTQMLHASIYAGLGLVVLYLGWLAYDLLIPGKLGTILAEGKNLGVGLFTAAGQLGLGAIVFTAIWTNGGGLGTGLGWTVAFGALGVVLQVVAFLVLDAVTPGKLTDILNRAGMPPLALTAAANQLAVAAIVCASIA